MSKEEYEAFIESPNSSMSLDGNHQSWTHHFARRLSAAIRWLFVGKPRDAFRVMMRWPL